MLRYTFLRYDRMGNPADVFSMSRRSIIQRIEMMIAITNVLSGAKPVFSAIYENGKFSKVALPMMSW